MHEKMKDMSIKFTQYNKGDIITGSIVMIGKNGAIVNIGGMRDGIVPIDQLDKIYKEGDAILVMVTGQIDEAGCIVLNAKDVNLALQQKEQISSIKVGSTIKFKINELTSSGLKGEFYNYSVFLPYSQCSKEDYLDKNSLKDREVDAVVLELNSLQKSMIVSTKILKETVDNSNLDLKIGDVVDGTVIKVFEKYAIVMLKDGVKSKISIQDLSYEKVNNMADILEEGKEYQFRVLDVNYDYSRISLGLKQMKENPLDAIFEQVQVGDEVSGVVEKIFPTGALIRLENGLTAFALTQENSERVNTATHYLYKLGAMVSGYISNKDLERKKLNIITKKKKVE